MYFFGIIPFPNGSIPNTMMVHLFPPPNFCSHLRSLNPTKGNGYNLNN